MQKRSDFKRYEQYPNKFSEEQVDLIVGTLLGDSYIPNTKGRYHCIGFEQSVVKKDYVEHVFEHLLPFTIKSSVKHTLNDKRKWGKGIYETCRFRSSSHPLFTEFRKEWYDEEGIKVLPNNLHLNWRRVSYWFADDGHNRNKGRKEIILCSESFTEKENEFLSNLLARIGIESSLIKKTGGTKFRIRIKACSYFDFIDGVSPYLRNISSIGYKVDISKVTKNTNPIYSKEDKCKAIDYWKTGVYSCKELSEIIGCHETTIKRWIKSSEVINE